MLGRTVNAGWDRGCWVGQRVLGGTEGAVISRTALPLRKIVHIYMGAKQHRFQIDSQRIQSNVRIE